VTDAPELNAAVYVLLMRARNAWDKAERASARDDARECARLTERAVEMRREADTLDPGHACAAWNNDVNGTH
jgi:hypothetical protein